MTREIRVKTHVRPHLFLPDRTLPADHAGRLVCVSCHLLGAPGDAHHDPPEPVPDAQQRAAHDD